MRIRFFRAWASNNSGAYVLLGRFRDVAVAEAAARELNQMLAVQDAWTETEPNAVGTAPSKVFADRHGLSFETGWPSWRRGMRCEVLGNQVLLEGHAAYMPPMFVGWIAKHGGHVETEIVHAHGAIIVRGHAWVRNGSRPESRDAAAQTLGSFAERVRDDPEVVAALAPPRWGKAGRAVHVTSEGPSIDIVLAPHEVTRATKAIRALADAEGVQLNLHVFEWIDAQLDPAALVAAAAGTPSYDVMLGDPGPTPERVSTAIVETTNLDPELAEAYVRDRPHPRTGAPPVWPRAIAQRVTEAHAQALLSAIREAGATASMVPADARRRFGSPA